MNNTNSATTTIATTEASGAGVHERNTVLALLVLTVIVLILLILLPCIIYSCMKSSWYFRYWFHRKPEYTNDQSVLTQSTKKKANRWQLKSKAVQTEITSSSIVKQQIKSSPRVGGKAGYNV